MSSIYFFYVKEKTSTAAKKTHGSIQSTVHMRGRLHGHNTKMQGIPPSYQTTEKEKHPLPLRIAHQALDILPRENNSCPYSHGGF